MHTYFATLTPSATQPRSNTLGDSKMNKLLLTLALLAPLANAAEIVGTTEENRAGEVFGSGIGVLLGGVAGGPVGALIGAGVGYFSGGEVQQGIGESGTAYLVKNEDGTISELRRNRLPDELRGNVANVTAQN